MRKTIIAAIAALALVHAAPLNASEFYEKNPPEVAEAFASAKPTGTGLLRQMMLRAYEAAYWQDAKKTQALSLTYFWNIDGPDIVERSIREMKIVRPNTAEDTMQKWESELAKAIPSVLEGERITAIYRPAAQSTAFYHNGKPTAQIKSAAFADAFFGIWLDPATTAPSLRAELLGQ